MQNKEMQLSLITLFHTQGIGNKRLIKLISMFGDANLALKASDEAWKEAGIPPRFIATRHTLDQNKIALDIDFLKKPNCGLLSFIDASYPELLKQSADPPALIYFCGNLSILDKPQIAIVGTRHPTQEGIDNAYRFARNLALNGFVITSGLALGIDTIAHQAAVNEGLPTIAVLGTGINMIYPQSNRPLAKQILQNNGLIISEFHNGTPPIAENFPKRNRIIASLALGTLVVEAALRSGSLITARLSFEENREVFVIPGSINNLQVKGCHYLIKQGAKLVENVNEIIEEFMHWLPKGFILKVDDLDLKDQLPPKALQTKKIPDKKIKTLLKSEKSDLALDLKIDSKINTPKTFKETSDPALAEVLAALGADYITIDKLIETTKLESSFIAHALVMLELEGVIEYASGGGFRRCC
ncbi:hypothetical protein AwWohl_09020 [Gammaproteobacteria bacterium]|nr:hypothetical protein AwWohl_09020 [Gammaproteobacteria bacterium]